MVEPNDVPAPDFRLGFLALFDAEDGQGRCGTAMVTNERGMPLEFRVSAPVRPSPLRRAIYGKTLWPYVEVELIAKSLLSELRPLPALVLTNRMSVLDVTSCATLCFVTDAAAFVQPSGAVRGYHRLLEAVGATPTALALVAATEAALASCAEQVAKAMRQFDPVEAFARMETTYGMLAESDGRYR